MAVRILESNIPAEFRLRIQKDLRVAGKKKGQHKARIAEIDGFKIDPNSRFYSIPLQYAKSIFGIKLHPVRVGFNINPYRFREEEFCKQEPVYKEAMTSLQNEGSVFLQLHCGWGKTFMAIVLAAELGLRTMVLVHRRFLARQFLEEGTNIIPDQMYFIDDKDMNFDQTKNFYICTEDRALKLPEDFRKTFGLIIVDEAKYWCTPKRVSAMLQFYPTHTMGLCAERERKDGYHVFLDHFFGHNIFRMSCKPFRVWKYFTKFQPDIKKPEGYSKAKIDWSHAMRSLAENEERNIFIRDLLRVFSKSKIMVFCTLTDHVDTLYDLLAACGESVGKFYKTQDSFVNCRVLITTYSKAEMGFDDKNLCEDFDGERFDMVLLASFFKEEIEQTAGRVFRSMAPTVLDVVDDYPSLLKHSKTRDKWFKSRRGQIMPPEYIW
jgi:hypothetical protein